MDRFCRECGKRAEPGNKVCIHCGTPFPNEGEKRHSEQEVIVHKKEKMPKKKKVMYSLVAVIVVILIGCGMWAQSYQSVSSVEKRLTKAISNEDVKSLQKLLVHEDGSAAKKEEAKAFLQFMKEEGKRAAEEMVSIQPHGKFLLFFTVNKVEAIDQYGVYDNPVKGLSFTFNGKEIDEYSKNNDKVVYGPLIPGKYDVEVVFKGKFGDSKKSESILLANTYGQDTMLDVGLDISDVTFYVTNYDDIDVSKAYVLLGEEKIALDQEGYTKEVGPIVLDGSQKAHTLVTMPWGEVKSIPIEIDSREMAIQAEVLNEDQYKALRKTLKDFGDNYVKALAEKSAKPLKMVTDEVKMDILDRLSEDKFYSGRFEKVEINKHTIQVDSSEKQPQIEIAASYVFNEAFHFIDEKPDLMENYRSVKLKLSYNKDNRSWKIHSTAPFFGVIDATDVEEGAKKLYGPGKKAVAKAKDAAVEDELDTFMRDYTKASVDAINYRDFEFMKDYTDKNGPRWKEAKDYIDYLESKGIYEDWHETELENVKEIEKNTWEVTVLESFTIHRQDSSTDKKYRTKVIVKQIDDSYKVYKLIETNEI